MYTVIRKYYILPGKLGDWIQWKQEGLVPLLREVPGFIASYDVEVRDDEVVSISLFETQAASEASQQRVATWLLTDTLSLLQTLPEITAGYVRASSDPTHQVPREETGEPASAFARESNATTLFFLPG